MRTHNIRPNETVTSIAAKYGVSQSALVQANKLSNPNLIRAGKDLKVPEGQGKGGKGGGDYTVRAGDTLSAIAARQGTTVKDLAKANGIKNPDLIFPGQKLHLSGGDHFEPGHGSSSGGAGRPSPRTEGPGGGSSTPRTGGSGRPSQTGGTGGVQGPAPAGDGKGGVSLNQLRRIMPNLSEAKARQYLPHLNRAMAEANINTPKRQAAFLAQLAHESGEFRYMEEIASGAAYEGRRDLGNTQPGDGTRFKGRGPIQLTGRANYRAAGQALGLDLVNNPRQASSPEVGFRTAAWFWNTRNLNKYADAGNFREVTRRINGGYNGLADRQSYYQRALAALT